MKTGELLYHAGSLGIVHDPKKNKQRFFPAHTNDVISITLNSNKSLVATGEINPRPIIHIWDPSTLESCNFAKQGLIKGVDNLAYSPDDKYLVCTCIDENHKIVLFDTENYDMIATEKGGNTAFFGIVWIDQASFLTVGEKVFKYWTVKNNQITGVDGELSGNEKGENSFTCAVKSSSSILCGNVIGQLKVWDQNIKLTSTLQLHDGPLDAIYITKDMIYTGGGDSHIKILDKSYNIIHSIDIYKLPIKTCDGDVRAICINDDETLMSVGLISGEIYEVNIDSKE